MTAFIRLRDPISPVEGDMELNIPIRFFCIAIGPEDFQNELHEIGRAYGGRQVSEFFGELTVIKVL